MERRLIDAMDEAVLVIDLDHRVQMRNTAAGELPLATERSAEKTAELCDLLEDVCLKLLERQTVPDAPCMRCAGYFRQDCVVQELQGECALKPRRGAEA